MLVGSRVDKDTWVAPIPEPFMAKMLSFLKAGATGNIVLHVHMGAIKACDITECLRVNQGQGLVESKEHLTVGAKR